MQNIIKIYFAPLLKNNIKTFDFFIDLIDNNYIKKYKKIKDLIYLGGNLKCTCSIE